MTGRPSVLRETSGPDELGANEVTQLVTSFLSEYQDRVGRLSDFARIINNAPPATSVVQDHLPVKGRAVARAAVGDMGAVDISEDEEEDSEMSSLSSVGEALGVTTHPSAAPGFSAS